MGIARRSTDMHKHITANTKMITYALIQPRVCRKQNNLIW